MESSEKTAFEKALDILLSGKTPRVWSFIASIFGDLARNPDDELSAHLINKMTALIGIKPEATRVALHRLRKEEWITVRKLGRNSIYSLTTKGLLQSKIASQRIYGLDVQVGDWIGNTSSGICCKIVSVSSKSNSAITMIVEDWLRYNTFRSQNGNGVFGTGGAVVFQLNENGHPMLDPINTSINASFYQNINSRFQYLNPQMHYVLDQTAHGFSVGDVVSITSSGFAKTTGSTANKTIGTVTNPGPGPNQFMLRPNTRIIDFLPAIPGNVGDFVYTDNSTAGGLTTNSSSGKIQFLKIVDPITTSVTGSQADPTLTASDVLEINETAITLTGGNLTQTISDINALTSTHGVTASDVTAPTTTATSLSTAYGLVGGYPPFSCTINGSTVNFSTTTAGQATYGQAVCIAEDMATDINAAGISNITAAKINTNDLQITESSGGAITIVNVGNDSNGNPFAGASSLSGVALSTSGSTSKYIKLTRTDDRYLFLRERINFAEKLKADIFISIHSDASKNRKASGFSIFSLSDKASDKEAKKLAQRENNSDFIGGLKIRHSDPLIKDNLIKIFQRQTMNESSKIANIVIKNIKKLSINNRGHRNAGFVVLKSLTTPSILVELGFITNKEEEKLLNDKKYLIKISKIISLLIFNYFNQIG